MMDLSNLILLAAEVATEHSSTDVLGTLGINWKLFLAQAINFSIILFILWRWVFKPVAGAMEKRRQKIEESILKAEVIHKQVQEAELAREEKLREALVEAEAIIKRTGAEAEKTKQETLFSARSEADKILIRAKETLEAEKRQMLMEIREEAATLIAAATEKIIKVKLDEKKDKELITEIVNDLK